MKMRSRWIVGVAGVAVVVVALVAGVVVGVHWGNRPWAEPSGLVSASPGGGSSSSESVVVPPVDGGSLCGLPGLDSSYTDVGSWGLAKSDYVEVEGVLVPLLKATDGPGRVDEVGVRSCFAHTVRGAVLANVWFMTQMVAVMAHISADKAEVWKSVVTSFVTPGAVNDGMLKNLDSFPSLEDTGAEFNMPAPSGFRVDSYSTDKARVTVLNRFDVGGVSSFSATTMNLVWFEGSWMIPGESQKAAGMSSAKVTDMTGFEMFGE